MRTLGLYALDVGAAAVLLAGCSGSQSPIGAPDAMPRAMSIAGPHSIVREPAASSYRVLHSFGSASDGSNPQGGLIDVGGTLDGTTVNGVYYGDGTVFSITTSGAERVLHRFSGYPNDGAWPHGDLIDVKGTLYGTTAEGGSCCNASGWGTVYSIGPSGNEAVLYDFGSRSRQHDGAAPQSGLIDVGGTLYSTTYAGGVKDNCPDEGTCGTIFSLTTSGAERVLRGFSKAKGYGPISGLINVGGTLYGTTSRGGAYGGGTVFSIAPGGAVKVLHSFGQGNDGSSPQAALVDVRGTLYGTTEAGGTNKCNTYSGSLFCGTVFSITPDGKERVLHNFSQNDGCSPEANLIAVKNRLYGTTSFCGSYRFFRGGTVFSLTTAGKETVLHVFGKVGDGWLPRAGLIDVNGTLYGTTFYGGSYESSGDYGNGTVFALTP